MVKAFGYLVAVALIGVLLWAASGRQGARASSQDAHDWVTKGAILLDVRTPQEFAAGHLDGAINVPVDRVADRIASVAKPDQPIVVYCRSGARSGAATRALRARGYGQVLDLGPMSAW